jgi:hypothetical protein
LLSGEAFKANVRLDLKFYLRSFNVGSYFVEHVPGQDDSKVGHWDHVAINRVAWAIASLVRLHAAVRYNLMAKEIEILPRV